VRQLIKKLVVTVGGLSLGVVFSSVLILFSGFSPSSVSQKGSDSIKISFNDGPKKVWGDMPVDQSMSEYSFVAPDLKTKKEFFLALKAKTDRQELDGRGGGFYFGSGKDMISIGVFDITRIKNHLTKLVALRGAGLSVSLLRHKMENLVHGVPVGAPVLGKLSSFFGKRDSPFGGQSDFHTGIDIASIYNSPIVSSAEGIVIFAGRKGAYGRTILIKHKNGLETLYAHLAKIEVKEGERVYRGQKIGLLGSTGRSTGPHLHYEVRLDGNPVNPKNYIEIAKLLKSVG